jgi:membrane associated rhomboid family serine protease
MTPAVQALIAINVAILFLQATVVSDADMFSALAFQWGNLANGRWWTTATYMFVHASFWHLAGNMYALFLFGPRLEHAWGAKKFVRFYLLAGLGGLVFHALFVRGDTMLVGASAAVFGVMGAYALLWPREELFLFGIIPLRVRTLVILIVGYNVAMGLYGTGGDASNVAYLAHLGGFAVAWFYMRTPPATSIEQLRQRIAQVPDADDLPRAIPRTMPRSRERLDEVDEIVAKSKAVVAKRPTIVAPPRPRDASAEELNRVLDKISEHGIDSLTLEERHVLEEMSKLLRDNR